MPASHPAHFPQSSPAFFRASARKIVMPTPIEGMKKTKTDARNRKSGASGMKRWRYAFAAPKALTNMLT